ncbi:uncharacterized protein PG986_010766 [Apiospora aurea]|uniref:Uncharacterized protein n=1 Tax=Apiospora aurea TaxID=335848 RepID=A0ABR1Q378_9PEZI
MCVIDSKLFHCEKCKKVAKIVVNEISTCSNCPVRDYEHKQFECPELVEKALRPLTGVCNVCDPRNGVPWGDWKKN